MFNKIVISLCVITLSTRPLFAMDVLAAAANVGSLYQKPHTNRTCNSGDTIAINAIKGFTTGAIIGSGIWSLAKLQQYRHNKLIQAEAQLNLESYRNQCAMHDKIDSVIRNASVFPNLQAPVTNTKVTATINSFFGKNSFHKGHARQAYEARIHDLKAQKADNNQYYDSIKKNALSMPFVYAGVNAILIPVYTALVWTLNGHR